MVAKAAGVNVGRLKVMPQRVHWQQRRVSCLVTEVIFELTAREFGATFRFGGDELRVLVAPIKEMTHERKGYSTEITATSEACNHFIGIFTSQFHLLFCLKSDHSLMQSNVVEH